MLALSQIKGASDPVRQSGWPSYVILSQRFGLNLNGAKPSPVFPCRIFGLKGVGSVSVLFRLGSW